MNNYTKVDTMGGLIAERDPFGWINKRKERQIVIV